MILLITAVSHARKCVAALKQNTGEEVALAGNARQALELLRHTECTLVVVDEHSVETEARGVEVLLEHLGGAMPVFVNLALSGVQRLVRDVMLAQRRCRREHSLLRKACVLEVSNALRNDLASILLPSDLALKDGGLPTASRDRVRAIREVAERMRGRLG